MSGLLLFVSYWFLNVETQEKVRHFSVNLRGFASSISRGAKDSMFSHQHCSSTYFFIPDHWIYGSNISLWICLIIWKVRQLSYISNFSVFAHFQCLWFSFFKVQYCFILKDLRYIALAKVAQLGELSSWYSKVLDSISSQSTYKSQSMNA